MQITYNVSKKDGTIFAPSQIKTIFNI